MVEEALILAAGEGTRMRPLTANVPKPLLPVAGRPFLEHQLLALAEAGVKRVAVLVGYRMHEIRATLGDGGRFGLEIDYLLQEQRLGTGHAVLQAAERFVQPFLCLNGDVLVNATTLRRLAEADAPHAMATAEVADASAYGAVEATDGRLTALREKRASGPGAVNAGLYRFDPTLFAVLAGLEPSPRGEYELTAALEAVAAEVAVVPVQGEWLDVGRPWDLLAANALLLAGLESDVEGTVEEMVALKGAVHVAEGAVVRSGSYIEGPVWIGPGAMVGPNAYLRGATSLGAGAKVGAASEVKNSLLMEGAKVPHHNYVGDSIIGRRCNLGSGTKVANLRLDKCNIHVVHRGARVDTGRRKLGVILGDDVQTGINTTIDAGTILGENSFVGPGRVVSGTWGPGSRLL